MKNNILIYEPHISGHHREYILHLLHFIHSGNPSKYNDIHFYLNSEFKAIIESSFNGINAQFISTDEYPLFKELIPYIKENKIDHFFFMYIDNELNQTQNIQFLHQNNIKISGIYFRPYLRISTPKSGLWKRLKYFRIQAIQKFYLNRSASKINELFILNDHDALSQFSSTNKIQKMKFLCDPMEHFKVGDGKKEREALGIKNDAKVILSFGSQGERKNALMLVRSMDNLGNQYKAPFTLCIVGKFSDTTYEKQVIELAKNIEAKHQHLNIIIVNKFADKDEFFNIADVVAVPYIDFFFSSGIFINAVHYGKPILTSNFGLIELLTQKYNIGKVIDPYQPESLADGIKYLFENPIPMENYQRYLKDHKHDIFDFANTILN